MVDKIREESIFLFRCLSLSSLRAAYLVAETRRIECSRDGSSRAHTEPYTPHSPLLLWLISKDTIDLLGARDLLRLDAFGLNSIFAPSKIEFHHLHTHIQTPSATRTWTSRQGLG